MSKPKPTMRNGIVKRGKTYSFVTRVPDPATGGTKPKWVGGFKTHAAAAAARDETRTDVRKGTYFASTKRTVEEYLDSWLATIDVRPKTRDGYAYNIRRYVVPRIGTMPLADLTGPVLTKLYADLTATGGRSGSPLGWRSVQSVHRTLRSALGTAVRLQEIPINPVERAVLPAKPKPTTREEWEANHRQIFTPVELRGFLSSCRDHRLGPLFHLAAYTGARRGELLYLRWDDIDLDAGTVLIGGTRGLASGQVIEGPTKGGRPRQVAIDQSTIEALRRHRAMQAQERLQAGELWDDTQDYLFRTAQGTPIHPDTPSSLMPKLCAKAEVPRLRFHDLRHTHASILLAAGVPTHEVADRLGHADATVTLQVYAQVLKERSNGLGDAFAAAVRD